MSGAAELIDRVTATVDYLRVTVGLGDPTHPDPDGHAAGSIACEQLVSDPDALAELSRTTATGRDAPTEAVAMSLLVQGYAFRVASIAIGAWLLGDAVIDVSPTRTSVQLARSRPSALHIDQPQTIDTADPLRALHRVLVDDHIAPLVANARRACRIGAPLLWANVGSSCASSFRAFVDPLPDRHAEIHQRAVAFFATARPELASAGTIVPVGVDWAWERRACCLWYQASATGSRCGDCSLWTDADRAERYAAIVAEQAGPTDRKSTPT